MRKFGLLAALLMTAAPVLAEVPVRAVTLFEAGLAEITRESQEVLFVSDDLMLEDYDPHLVLTVPQAQVNDVLKSLRISGAVSSAEIRLDGASPVEDAFARLPVGPEEVGDLAALLGALPGTLVTVHGPAGFDPVAGRVMGVTQGGCETAPCPPTLLLRAEEGLMSVPLDPSRRVVLSSSLQADVDDALEALARNGIGSERVLMIETESEGSVSLSYVVPAPVWKIAYRAVTGEDGMTRLQAWAVLENVSGADWDGVSLTLSSGSPNTLQADLTGRDWRVRDVYESDPVQKRGAPRIAQALRESDAFMRLEAAPMAELAPGTVTRDRGLDSRFTFPDPVYLEQGEMISLPFLSEEVPVERTLVWRGQLRDRTGNPDLVLRVENPLPIRLPGGIMTVSDETGYLGDAAFPVLVPGDAADVPFGQDQRVEVRETATERSAERRVTVSKGAVRISERWVRTTEYRVSAPSGEAPALTVLHPEQAGWAISGVSPAQNRGTSPSEGGRVHRFELPAGAERLMVEEERPRTEVWQVSDLPRERLVSLLTDRVSSEDRARLERILEATDLVGRVREDLSRVAEERDRSVNDQERARRMMGSAPSGSDMEARFRTSVLELEDRIEALDAREAELIVDLRAAEERLDAVMGDERD